MKALSTRQIRVRNPKTGDFEGVNAFASESTEEILDKIQKKGQETLDSIPEDYAELAADVDKLSEEIDNNDVYDLLMVRKYLGYETVNVNDIVYNYTGGLYKFVDVVIDAELTGVCTIVVGEYSNTESGEILLYSNDRGVLYGTITSAGKYKFTVTNGLMIRFVCSQGAEVAAQECYAKRIKLYTGDIVSEKQGLPSYFTGLDKIEDGNAYNNEALETLIEVTGVDIRSIDDITYSYTGGLYKFVDVVVDASLKGEYEITIGDYANTSAGSVTLYANERSSVYKTITSAGKYKFDATDGLLIRLVCSQGAEVAAQECYAKSLILKKTDINTSTSHWKNKNVLCIGDSLTYAKVWQHQLAEKNGMNVYTHAYGGRTIVEVVNGDGDNRNPKVLAPLTIDDVTGMDLIILFAGYNDRGTEDGAVGDLYPTQDTICGRVQFAVNKVYELLSSANNLDCRVVFVTPHCAGKYEWNDVDGYGEYPAGSKRTMRTLASAIENVCRENSIPCLNLWETSGISRHTWGVYSASPTAINPNPDASSSAPYPANNDQLHLNTTVGYPYLGQLIAKFVDTI